MLTLVYTDGIVHDAGLGMMTPFLMMHLSWTGDHLLLLRTPPGVAVSRVDAVAFPPTASYPLICHRRR